VSNSETPPVKRSFFAKYQGYFYLVIGILQFFLILFFLHIISSPLNSKTPKEKTVITVPKGASFSQVTQILEKHELLKFPLYFRISAHLKGYTEQIQAGEFEVLHSWTVSQLMDHLVSGQTQLYPVTIPEGYNIKEVAQHLENLKLGSKEKFLELSNNLCALAEIPSLLSWDLCKRSGAKLSAEGFLFPETYFFPKGESESKILQTMTRELFKNFSEPLTDRVKELGLNRYQVLVLASMIEKETGTDSDRAIISSVFHNRLKRKMRLESDPTVIYGIPNFNGDLKRKDLKAATIYNTYVIPGLPPTPITNPGKASIHSALYPAKSDYLFFVAREDGSSQFSKTLKEHNRAVRKYQMRRKK